MKIFKFTLLWISMTLIMLITWSMGSFLGNAITQSNPPALKDPSSGAVAFLIVCSINGFFLSLLIWSTRYYSGFVRSTWLIVYVFVVQFLLTQMETYFFSESIHITNAQIVSILIAGFSMALATISIGLIVSGKMNRLLPKHTFSFNVKKWSSILPLLALLVVVIYPLIYLVFGYYIAWQNENLRIFYTQLVGMNSFVGQLSDSFQNGVYLYQILRGLIWVGVSAPVVLMLQQNSRTVQYFLVGLFSALPTIMLFIPNPYMPADVAFTHFVETSSSNFLWGLVITFAINKFYKEGAIQVKEYEGLM
ncbi:MAG: hypothetical protein C0490_13210 [Marivirga sp.]|nr:hypothetical protein [Marivirga sp.]